MNVEFALSFSFLFLPRAFLPGDPPYLKLLVKLLCGESRTIGFSSAIGEIW